jgi:DNA end-binding protein Ku
LLWVNGVAETREARDKGLMGMLLRYPYEVRGSSEYFDDIQDVKITKDMLELAKHIVEQKSGHFDPDKFEDHYEAALQELLEKKQKGQPLAKMAPRTSSNVVNLMDALRESLKSSGGQKEAATAKKPKGKPTAKRKAG